MRKSLIWILVIMIILVVGLVVLYEIDMNRMENNKPVLFSTWGYQYVPPVSDFFGNDLNNISGEENEEKNKTNGEFIKLEDLPKEYGRDEAINDGCVVCSLYNIYNKQNLETFISNVENDKESFVRLINSTIEGDSIITDYSYSNGIIQLRKDNTRDSFASEENRVITSKTYSTDEYSFIKTQNDNHIVISLVKKAETAELYQSMPLFIEDEVFVCSYNEDKVSQNQDNFKESFVGTIIDEAKDYIIVEPNEDESETKSADKIQIDLASEKNKDYLYGVGRKVLIYYDGTIMESYPAQIKDANIEVDGYTDFSLDITNDENKSKLEKIINLKEIDSYESDVDIYLYGLKEVNVNIPERETYSLKDALLSGKITNGGLLQKANKDNKSGLNEKQTYRDGGSTIWKYDNYAILKMNTVNGDNDIYIGTVSMETEIFDNI